MTGGKNPMYRAPPWWYRYVNERLRQEYRGVAPWEWLGGIEAHPRMRPIWHQRVVCAIRAEEQRDAEAKQRASTQASTKR